MKVPSYKEIRMIRNEYIEFETLLEFAGWFKEQLSKKDWERCQIVMNWHKGWSSKKLKILFPDKRIIKIKIIRWFYDKDELYQAAELMDWGDLRPAIK